MNVHLSDVLEAQQAEQRRSAVRLLLRQPLLISRGADRQKFSEVRKHAGWLAEWFAREAGWPVQIDHSVARLRKLPAAHADGTRPAQPGKQPFSRRRYVLACLALATLERAESQVTLGWLVDRIVRLAREDDLAAAGVTFTLQTREERSDLVAQLQPRPRPADTQAPLPVRLIIGRNDSNEHSAAVRASPERQQRTKAAHPTTATVQCSCPDEQLSRRVPQRCRGHW